MHKEYPYAKRIWTYRLDDWDPEKRLERWIYFGNEEYGRRTILFRWFRCYVVVALWHFRLDEEEEHDMRHYHETYTMKENREMDPRHGDFYGG